MQYILTENKQVVLGPMNWKQRFIQSELDDLEVEYTVAPIEQGYIKIDDQYELFPLTGIDVPTYDPTYEQLVGPFYTFTDNAATSSYTKQDLPIDTAKSTLKALAASERYKKEISGTKVTVQGVEVTVDTDRMARNVFVQQYTLMGATDTTHWKFPEAWLTVSKTDLADIVTASTAYIQTQFDWEKEINDQITAATTTDQLKAIVIVAPVTRPVAV